MIRVDLYSKDGEHVANVPFLPYATPPDAIMWANRFFFHRTDGKYYEGFVHFIVPPPTA